MAPGAPQVSSSDVYDYYAAFAEFDRDNSRNISTSELGQVMRSLGENPTSMELEVRKSSDVVQGFARLSHLLLCYVGKLFFFHLPIAQINDMRRGGLFAFVRSEIQLHVL